MYHTTQARHCNCLVFARAHIPACLQQSTIHAARTVACTPVYVATHTNSPDRVATHTNSPIPRTLPALLHTSRSPRAPAHTRTDPSQAGDRYRPTHALPRACILPPSLTLVTCAKTGHTHAHVAHQELTQMQRGPFHSHILCQLGRLLLRRRQGRYCAAARTAARVHRVCVRTCLGVCVCGGHMPLLYVRAFLEMARDTPELLANTCKTHVNHPTYIWVPMCAACRTAMSGCGHASAHACRPHACAQRHAQDTAAH